MKSNKIYRSGAKFHKYERNNLLDKVVSDPVSRAIGFFQGRMEFDQGF